MRTVLAISASVAVLAGCETVKGTWSNLTSSGAKATAVLEATKGNNVTGTINFVQTADRVRVSGSVSGLKPDSEVGFHIHEAGDCSSGDGMSTGGHWNPDSTPHGPQAAPHHAGDMPSLVADASGNAKASFSLDGVTVAPGPKSVVGRGLIVHKDPDDFKTQPTGNAGARVACGIIQRAS